MVLGSGVGVTGGESEGLSVGASEDDTEGVGDGVGDSGAGCRAKNADWATMAPTMTTPPMIPPSTLSRTRRARWSATNFRRAW